VYNISTVYLSVALPTCCYCLAPSCIRLVGSALNLPSATLVVLPIFISAHSWCHLFSAHAVDFYWPVYILQSSSCILVLLPIILSWYPIFNDLALPRNSLQSVVTYARLPADDVYSDFCRAAISTQPRSLQACDERSRLISRRWRCIGPSCGRAVQLYT